MKKRKKGRGGKGFGSAFHGSGLPRNVPDAIAGGRREIKKNYPFIQAA